MKKIIIVGATSGIGKALVETFASRGVPVGIAGRSAEKLAQLENRYPGMITSARIDVTSPEATVALEELISRMGGMDLYIHVAGIAMRNPDVEPEKEVKVAETDAIGLARMVATAFRYFKNTGRPGQIAAVTSVAGTRGIGELAAYSASKSFASKYLEALQQLANIYNMDVAITDIRPGWTRTPLVDPNKKYMFEMELSDIIPSILKAIAHKRRVATIDYRWQLLCALWRILPRPLWLRLHGFGL